MPEQSFIYSVPYLFVFFLLIVLTGWEFRLLNRQQNIKPIRWCTLALLFFFFGFRGFVFTDFIAYYPWFENLPSLWTGSSLTLLDPDIETAFEPGFILYSIICKSLIPNYFVWNMISVLIDLAILDILFRRYSKYYVLPFLIFFVMGSAILEFNILRNTKAILIFLLALPYIEQRKPGKYFLMILLACMFHISSIVYFPLYFFLHRRWPKIVLAGILAGGLILTFGHIQYLLPVLTKIGEIIGGRAGALIEVYKESDLYNQPYEIGFGYIERVLTYLLVLFSYGKWSTKNEGGGKIHIPEFIHPLFHIFHLFCRDKRRTGTHVLPVHRFLLDLLSAIACFMQIIQHQTVSVFFHPIALRGKTGTADQFRSFAI